MSANSAILSVFERWQIICYLCGGLELNSGLQKQKMLISLIIVTLLALLFGKVTIKEIKEYVRKHQQGDRTDNGADTGSGDSGAGNTSTGNSAGNAAEGEERISEKGEER